MAHRLAVPANARLAWLAAVAVSFLPVASCQSRAARDLEPGASAPASTTRTVEPPPMTTAVPRFPPDAAGWDAFVQHFLESTFRAQPGLAVFQGRHEFDGQLPDWSPAGIRREAARLRSARDAALAFPPEALDERRRFERRYLATVADGDEREEYLPGAADLLFTSVHEIWPGHFLHFLHSNRSPSPLGRVFVGYAFAEGWAHYSEEMMWEAGLGGDPETHIGQLLNALLRNARYLVAIGLHAGTMTVAEAEALFLRAHQDRGTARQQAARGTFDPAFLNYTLGKLVLRKLRAEWCAVRGGRAAWQAFHDKVLSFGGPPLGLIRGALLGAESGPPL